MSTCQTCRFWDGPRHREPSDGMCRRHAPMTVLRVTTESSYASGNTDKAVWPRTFTHDRCGDHEPLRVGN